MITNINTPEYWDGAWAKHAGVYRMDAQRHQSARYMAGLVSPGATVLDIGGGLGLVADCLAEKADVTVLDFSEYALQQLAERGYKTIWADLSKYEGPQFGAYDVAICTDLLEHLDEPWRAVQCAYDHAQRAIFAVPNNCMGPDSCKQHLRTYTRQELQEQLSLWPNVRIEPEPVGFDLIAEVWK